MLRKGKCDRGCDEPWRGGAPTSLRVQAKALTKADKALQDQGYFSHPDWLLLSSRPHDPVTLLFPESASGLACAVPPVWVTSFRMSLGQLLPAQPAETTPPTEAAIAETQPEVVSDVVTE